MHLMPYFVPDGLIFPQIFKTEYFLDLKLVQVFIDKRTLYNIPLLLILALMVVILNMLAFFVVIVVEVPHSMGVLAFFAAVDTQSSQVEPTQ